MKIRVFLVVLIVFAASMGTALAAPTSYPVEDDIWQQSDYPSTLYDNPPSESDVYAYYKDNKSKNHYLVIVNYVAGGQYKRTYNMFALNKTTTWLDTSLATSSGITYYLGGDGAAAWSLKGPQSGAGLVFTAIPDKAQIMSYWAVRITDFQFTSTPTPEPTPTPSTPPVLDSDSVGLLEAIDEKLTWLVGTMAALLGGNVISSFWRGWGSTK